MTTTGQRVERYADVDLYGVLHLTAEARTELIERAYKVRIAEVHPDRAGAASTEQAALVNAAGEILRDLAARARYDAVRAARRARTGASHGTSSEEQRWRELEEHLAAARRDLAATQVQLAATEASRRDLAEQVRKVASQPGAQPSR